MTQEGLLLDRDGNRKYLVATERRRFRSVAIQLCDIGEKLFCLCLYHTGCRVSEALELTVEHIDVSAGFLVFRTLKQRKHTRYRSVPVPWHLIALLKAYTAARATTGKVRVWPFSRTKAWRLIKSVMVASDIHGAQAVPKGLRHGYAVACVEKEIPVSTIQKWMGHANPANTAIYMDFSREDERRLAKRIWEESEI